MVFCKFITSIKMEMNNKTQQKLIIDILQSDYNMTTDIQYYKDKNKTQNVQIATQEGEVMINLEGIQRSCSKGKMTLTKCTARTTSHNKLVERLRKKLANKK